MTPSEAKTLCILAHKGQFRRPRRLIKEELTRYLTQTTLLSFSESSKATIVLPNTSILGIAIEGYFSIKEPYSSHPIAIADMMTTDEEKIVAYLHDVIEDTDYTYERLLDLGLSEISGNARNALKLLTKQPGQNYDLYIFNISCCSIARKVKLADMFHNMSCNPTESAKAKYLKALPILLKTI